MIDKHYFSPVSRGGLINEIMRMKRNKILENNLISPDSLIREITLYTYTHSNIYIKIGGNSDFAKPPHPASLSVQ